jgi:type IV pilus assembly protein PilX
MIRSPKIRRGSPRLPSAQRGVALIVALILLVLALLVGLAASRGTLLEERMSSNLYDRSLAFQRAESGLRAAEGAITDSWKIADLKGTDCSPAVSLCTETPSDTFTGTDATWVDVPTPYDVDASVTPDNPQYTVELMGTGPSESNLDLNANADYTNYGNSYPPDNVAYYRVTARSSNPASAGDRSVVVLQTTVKRSF